MKHSPSHHAPLPAASGGAQALEASHALLRQRWRAATALCHEIDSSMSHLESYLDALSGSLKTGPITEARDAVRDARASHTGIAEQTETLQEYFENLDQASSRVHRIAQIALNEALAGLEALSIRVMAVTRQVEELPRVPRVQLAAAPRETATT